MSKLWFVLSFVLVFVHAALAAEPPFDPFFWLEEVEGEQATTWVKQQNTRTVSDLEKSPLFKQLQGEIHEIYFAKDRVSFGSFSKDYFWDFWKDKEHTHGLIRRTTLEEYKKDQPNWETIFDFDALSAAENVNWVYKGSTGLGKDSERVLMYLSRGGKDASEVREFDYTTRKFVENGFYVPEAKTKITALEENNILIGTDFGPGSLTNSGYPRIIKQWTRGKPLSEAVTVFEGQPTDVSVGAMLFHDGAKRHMFFYRSTDFFNSEVYAVRGDGTLRKLPIPGSASLLAIEDGSYRLELLKSAKPRFDSSKFEVVQNFATSRDGTQVPYFVLKPKDFKADGKYPTLLYGYGGFNISMTPSYSSVAGKIWLERGGVYVIANIRGGGEFGPEWHDAALKQNRQRAFDDFAAVAEDLIARKITAPEHLGIMGGSNGGLLVGTVMVQRPDLFNAAVVQVPLLDMMRFSKLLAGASWIGEYGDPANAEECGYLLAYSPYHNVKPGKRYPMPLFTTSTKDDRVHPAHARKMAARMSEQGHPFYYYENINGGHAGAASLEESAYMATLEYTYLWSRLK